MSAMDSTRCAVRSPSASPEWDDEDIAVRVETVVARCT